MSASATAFTPPERYHPRVDANFMVKLIQNGRAILAKARDLSMAGIYLAGSPSLPSDRFTISIPLPNDREVITACHVRRRTAEGVAVEFDDLDWDDMFALARFLHPRLP